MLPIQTQVTSCTTAQCSESLRIQPRCRLSYFRQMEKALECTASRLALGLTHPPLQWVPGALSPWVKRPGRGFDNSHSSSAEDKE